MRGGAVDRHQPKDGLASAGATGAGVAVAPAVEHQDHEDDAERGADAGAAGGEQGDAGA